MSAAGIASIAAIDFEASCLPAYGRSFPIEVALCRIDGVVLFSTLIRPHPDWTDWAWDPAAERVHGISRDELIAEGRPCAEVLAALNLATESLRVVSDNAVDGIWLQTLAEGAGGRPAFAVGDINDLLAELTCGPADKPLIAQASERAFAKFPTIHRATTDAQRLAEILRLVVSAAGLD